jgi:hypothetical protein
VRQIWQCRVDLASLVIDYVDSNKFLDTYNQFTVPIEYITAAKNEWYIYGSAGHGRFARVFPHDNDRWGYSNSILGELYTENRYIRQKQYELKDHLGNVRVVLSDMKISTTANDTVAPFKADVLAAYSHYPFGMLQPGMYSEAGTTYRFGFNGMLRDDDVKDLVMTGPLKEGVGNSYDFGAILMIRFLIICLNLLLNLNLGSVMPIVKVNINNLSDAQKFLFIAENMKFVQSAEIIESEIPLMGINWIHLGRPATDQEIDSMIIESENDISTGQIFSFEEAKSKTMNFLKI